MPFHAVTGIKMPAETSPQDAAAVLRRRQPAERTRIIQNIIKPKGRNCGRNNPVGTPESPPAKAMMSDPPAMLPTFYPGGCADSDARFALDKPARRAAIASTSTSHFGSTSCDTYTAVDAGRWVPRCFSRASRTA